MRKILSLSSVCTAVLIGLSSANAALPTAAYVDSKSGSDTGSCPITAPCATLNYALSQISAGGNITFLQPGIFGPIFLTGAVSITGVEPNSDVWIVADPTALVGCIGQAPGTCGSNNGYAVEVAAGVNDNDKFSHLLISTGSSGTGALKFTSGHNLHLRNDVFRGNSSSTAGPMVALYPNNPGTTQAHVYFSQSDIAYHGAGTNVNAGAVEVKPSGNTSLKLHFNHVEVHNASYGIRTDGSLLSGPSDSVATFISDSEFFSFTYAAVNAFSTAGTGTVDATFENTHILNSQTALKANGPQSYVVLNFNTVSGNSIGIQTLGGATVYTSGNNTVKRNTTDLSGSVTSAPPL